MYKRVLLKVSGEAFANQETGFGIDHNVVKQIAKEIVKAKDELGTEIAIVCGGGNIVRGMSWARKGISRARADHMGMLGIVINSLALQDAFESIGQPARVQSAITMTQVAESYIPLRAIRHMEKGRVVIFAAGTGDPFVTSDTAAALRAAEIDADVVIKGTHSGIEGIYDSDPRENPEANKIDHITYFDVLQRKLNVMDSTAITFCMDNDIPIIVFDLMGEGNVKKVLEGEKIGTKVSKDPEG